MWLGKLPGPYLPINQRPDLDVYANIRPCRLRPGIRGVLKNREPGDIDFIVLRENTEHMYAKVGGIFSRAGEAELAIEASENASEKWRSTPVKERARCLYKAAELMTKRRFELAAWLMFETGKNRLEALGDVDEAIDMLNSYAEDMEELAEEDKKWEALGWRRVPLGIGTAITPWNFAVAILTGPNVAKAARSGYYAGFDFWCAAPWWRERTEFTLI